MNLWQKYIQGTHPVKPDPTGVKLNKTTLTLGVGKKDSSVTATIEPTGANQELTVTSKDQKVATVDGLKVTGVTAGTVEVEVASKVKPGIKATIAVKVAV